MTLATLSEMAAEHQAAEVQKLLSGGGAPVLNLHTPAETPPVARTNQLDFLRNLNRGQASRFPENDELAARIANFELAARMQAVVPEIVDLSQETAETKLLYGLNHPVTQRYATRAIMARRLIEHGVRFVGVYLSGQPWDTHSNDAETTKSIAAGIDQPSAALVLDLKRRGLLDSTIVLWLGEFGRTPISEGANGRDHSRSGFSLWIAGGGFKSGYVHGATDDIGYKSIVDPVRFCDLHATLLQALGMDHTQQTYLHDGRLESLTDHEVTHARVIEELLA